MPDDKGKAHQNRDPSDSSASGSEPLPAAPGASESGAFDPETDVASSEGASAEEDRPIEDLMLSELVDRWIRTPRQTGRALRMALAAAPGRALSRRATVPSEIPASERNPLEWVGAIAQSFAPSQYDSIAALRNRFHQRLDRQHPFSRERKYTARSRLLHQRRRSLSLAWIPALARGGSGWQLATTEGRMAQLQSSGADALVCADSPHLAVDLRAIQVDRVHDRSAGRRYRLGGFSPQLVRRWRATLGFGRSRISACAAAINNDGCRNNFDTRPASTAALGSGGY